MIKYFPYKSDKPNKKYYIITNDNKKVYFGASGYSDFTIHKHEARKQRYIDRQRGAGVPIFSTEIWAYSSYQFNCFIHHYKPL